MSFLAMLNAYREKDIKLSHAESLCVVELKGALASVDALEVAGRKGHDVSDALGQARERIDDLRSKMPRGHGLWLTALTVLTILLALTVILVLPRLSPSSGAGSGAEPGRVWRALEKASAILTRAPWVPVITAVYVLVVAFVLQRRLRRRHARTFLLTSMGAEVGIVLVLVLARLMVTPAV